jgi:hypothetical protein
MAIEDHANPELSAVIDDPVHEGESRDTDQIGIDGGVHALDDVIGHDVIGVRQTDRGQSHVLDLIEQGFPVRRPDAVRHEDTGL